jgi:CheY-like chemotaxis protein
MDEWRLLVIEDDPDGQELVGRILRHHKVKFDSVFDAEKALDLLANQEYTAAVVDLALPGIDGWSFLKYIKGNPKMAELPCFAITAYHSPEVAVQAVQSGFAAYFPKPLDPTSFVSDMTQILKSSKEQ